MSRPAVSANGPGAGTEMLLGCARPSLCARAERCIACWPRQRVRSRTFSCLSFISPVTCSPVIYLIGKSRVAFTWRTHCQSCYHNVTNLPVVLPAQRLGIQVRFDQVKV